TRLLGALTPEQATALYVCFLQDAFAMMTAVQEEREQLSLVLCYTPADEIEAFEAADLDGCLMLAQRGETLGERLQHCFDDLFTAGFQRVIVLGADTPTLPMEAISEAFEQLIEPKAVVLGPTTDGGYYLIGLRQAQPELFAEIAWGSEAVLRQTQARAQEIGASLILLSEWSDVDTPQDLERLQQQIAAGAVTAPRTAKFLRKCALKS
ncbi:MAG TPA: TIGR04282 family arsenosugar biosynthesis glycosyltransferase, partial [Blastocatellia bacterium]|nr:TIGR04282 family arsenosugar biosynthesis glycosyltransferase [Blastocatellia bacterium]